MLNTPGCKLIPNGPSINAMLPCWHGVSRQGFVDMYTTK